MDFIIQNNANLLPRDQVRVERLEAVPLPDGRRVNVLVQLTPFRERPNLDIAITNDSGVHLTSTTVIEIMTFTMTFCLHLRANTSPGEVLSIRTTLYYDSLDAPQDIRQVRIRVYQQPHDDT